MSSIEEKANHQSSDSRRKIKPPARKKSLSVSDYLEGIQAGNRAVLSRAITILESKLSKHKALGREIVNGCLPHAGKSIRVGITGVPGVGKSTFIEALGGHLTGKGHKLAVLAIDPSSQRTKGSILGDKTRMESLSSDPNAFIRPSPSSGTLGGVAKATRETILLCEAAGYDVILVETVGVGQSETAVHSMVDFFLLLMLAGAGDELQGIKRGIMEMADSLVINKADGDNVDKARLAKRQYLNALHLFPLAKSGWPPKVEVCSAMERTGISQLWDSILDYQSTTKNSGFFAQKRRDQDKYWMFESIRENLETLFYQHPEVKQQLTNLEADIAQGKISSHAAAEVLMNLFQSKK